MLALELGDPPPRARAVPAGVGELGEPQDDVDLVRRRLQLADDPVGVEQVRLGAVVLAAVEADLPLDDQRLHEPEPVADPFEDLARALVALGRLVETPGHRGGCRRG